MPPTFTVPFALLPEGAETVDMSEICRQTSVGAIIRFHDLEYRCVRVYLKKGVFWSDWERA